MEEDKNKGLGLGKLSLEDLKKTDREKIKNCQTKDLQPCLEYSEWRCFEQIIGRVVQVCKYTYFNRSHQLLELHEWSNRLEGLETDQLKTLCKTALQYHLDFLSKQLSFRVSKAQNQPKLHLSLHELLTQKAKYSTFEVTVQGGRVQE